MSTNPPARVIELDEQKAVRWLAARLATARAVIAREPSAEAVARIRVRVLGEHDEDAKDRSLAA